MEHGSLEKWQKHLVQDGFKWGMTALPAVKMAEMHTVIHGLSRHGFLLVQSIRMQQNYLSLIYTVTKHVNFAKAGAIQPVLGIADKLSGDNVMFYSIYDNGAKAAMGNFAAFEAIPGVEVRTVFFDPVNSLVSGDMDEQAWIDGIISASDQMRANLK